MDNKAKVQKLKGGIPDQHTLFVTGLPVTITNVELQKFFANFFYDCEQVFPGTDYKFWGTWRINICTKSDGTPTGAAYVFLFEPAAYNVIRGMNIDGTKRTKDVPNPKYQKKTAAENLSWEDIWTTSTKSWADMAEEDSEPEFLKEVIEEPWVKFRPIMSRDVEFIPKVVRCLAFPPEEGRDRYTLFAKGVPEWVNSGQIKSLFEAYTEQQDVERGFPIITIKEQKEDRRTHTRGKGFFGSSPSSEGDWRVQGKQKKSEKMNMIFVRFNSQGNSCLFALRMAMKVTIEGMANHKGKKVDLFFSHAKEQIVH